MSRAIRIDITVNKYGSFTNKYSRLSRCQKIYLHWVAATIVTWKIIITTKLPTDATAICLHFPEDMIFYMYIPKQIKMKLQRIWSSYRRRYQWKSSNFVDGGECTCSTCVMLNEVLFLSSCGSSPPLFITNIK